MDEGQKKRLNAVFMGTPDFAATVLEAVLRSGVADVRAVYTQPDRPCGRGHKCLPSAVKRLALEQGLPILQPVNFKEDADVAQLAAFAPDVLLVAAYGLILPQRVLDIPTLGPLNVHASLLPKYRGAAPIQWAIMNGETETGITIMRMEAGLDTGPMLLREAIPIGPDETAGQLHDRLAALGGQLLVAALPQLQDGLLSGTIQDNNLATYAPKISKDDALIRWDMPAHEVHDRIRAMSPKPGAFLALDTGANAPIRLLAQPGAVGQPKPQDTPPGCVLGLSEGRLSIACADNTYLLSSVQPSGKKAMDAKSFYCGYLSKLNPHAPLVCQPPADFLGG